MYKGYAQTKILIVFDSGMIGYRQCPTMFKMVYLNIPNQSSQKKIQRY